MTQDWANAYQQNRAAATAELLTLLTKVTSNKVPNPLLAMTHLASFNNEAVSQASGCSTEVTEDDVEEGEVDKLVKGLLQQVTQVACV